MLTVVALVLTGVFFASGSETEVNKNEEHIIFPPLPVSVYNSNNTLCKEHSELYIQNLKNFTLWAYEMWDATAKSSTGTLTGSTFQMGNFDECLEVEAPFPTQYCLATIKADVPEPKWHKDPFELRHNPYEPVLDKLYPFDDPVQVPRNMIKMAWCVPASCSPQDLQEFLNAYVKTADVPLKELNITYSAEVPELLCHSKEETFSYTIADIAFILFTLSIAGLVGLASLYDHVQIRKNDGNKKPKEIVETFPEKLLLSFSALRTRKEWIKTDESSPALTLLHGLRTFCLISIIVNHRIAVFASSALINRNFIEAHYRFPKYLLFAFTFHGEMFVDSFFVFSGLLTTYQLLKQLDKKKNPLTILLNRYFRLTPVYAFVIFYYATLLDHMGNGPEWKSVVTSQSEDCRKNWWANLLYISNYYDDEHMCMALSWYLPSNFHFYIIGLIVCILIHKNKKVGLGSLLFVTMVAIAIPLAVTIAYLKPAVVHIWPTFMNRPQTVHNFRFLYSKSHIRAISFFIGMIGGYVYFKLKGKDKQLGWFKSYAILFVSATLLVSTMFTPAVFYNAYYDYDAVESAFYASFHKVGYSLGTFGFIYAVSYSNTMVLTYIRKFLSWWPCVILSKLTYGAYLVNMSFQYITIGSFRSPQYFSYYNVGVYAIADASMTFFLAFLMYFGIEEPFRVLYREVQSKINGSSSAPPLEVQRAAALGHNNKGFDSNENYPEMRSSENVSSKL